MMETNEDDEKTGRLTSTIVENMENDLERFRNLMKTTVWSNPYR